MTASATCPTSATSTASERTLLICSGVCALIMLDTNVVAVALPSIARSLNATFVDIEWVVSAYMLAFASFLLPAGSIADLLGRRRVMLAGLALFALASLFCALAWSPLALNAARAAKGLGASLLLTSALAIIGHTFQRDGERARAWAVWGACMGAAMTVAPLVGGVLTATLGWRAIFYLNLPVVALLAWLVWRHVGESRQSGGAFDPAGALLFSAALFCIMWALIDAGAAGWGSAATLARLGTGLLLLGVFIVVELALARPMIDLRLFRDARFTGAVVGMFGYATAAQVMMTFLPLYLQNALGLPATLAGLGMLPFALAMVLCSRLAGRVYATLSDRQVLALGLSIVAAGNAGSALAASVLSYPALALGMLVTGAGAGLLNGATQKAILGRVPRERSGMGSGISTTTRFVGIMLAVGGLGAVLAARTGSAFERLAAAAGAPALSASHQLIGRIVAGNAGQDFAALPPAARAVAAAAAQAAFVDGFSSVLILAAALAALAGAIVFVLKGRD